MNNIDGFDYDGEIKFHAEQKVILGLGITHKKAEELALEQAVKHLGITLELHPGEYLLDFYETAKENGDIRGYSWSLVPSIPDE